MRKRIGIQGGQGSFNHQGWIKYAKENNYEDWEVIFLHTTKKVLDGIEKREIDKGHFGIYNTLGGLVEETALELGKHKFNIVDWYKFPINHFLMKKRGVELVNIKRIMAHPQGFKQCKNNLKKFFPKLEQIVGVGERIDPSKLAEDLAKGLLEEDIAIIGPEMLSTLNNLEVIKGNLQDGTENFTTFVIVEAKE